MAMPDFTGTITITAPASVDGRGEVAVLNTAGSNYVGNLWDTSGFDGPSVRTSQDDIPEGHGQVFGSFYHGARSFTLDIKMSLDTTFTLSNARLDKLLRATNAMGADGTITWAESGTTKLINFRREQPPRGPDNSTGRILLSLIASDPRIYANTATSGSSPLTNSGTVASPPTFTFTPTSNGTVVITNTTSGLGSPALTLTVGTGYLTTGSAVTVDVKNRTVTQGGTRKDGAVVYPGSTWWEFVPGANTFTFTNSSSTSASFRSAWI